MLEVRVVDSIIDIGKDRWNALFPGEVEGFDYLRAVEEAGLAGFRWRYALVEHDGALLAAAPGFHTEYDLETTLNDAGRRVAAVLRRLAPRALTLSLGCLGSPCTETALAGFAPEISPGQRVFLLKILVDAFERDAGDCALLAVKDVPEHGRRLWEQALRRGGYRPIPGLPVAHLDIDFESLEAYFARLSAGTRRDMRRKLRARCDVRVEVRTDLDGVLDRVLALYAETRARADMQFEDLTPAYFTGALERVGSGAFCVLYYADEVLLAANLLLRDGSTLLDKFFCMDAAAGRRYNLYFLSWFNNLDLCLELGLRRYQSGQAAYANKLRLGSSLTRTFMYFRHRNRLVNGVLQLVAPYFAADPTLEAAA